MGFATRSFKIISLISGRANKNETSRIMIHYVRGSKTRAGTHLIGNQGHYNSSLRNTGTRVTVGQAQTSKAVNWN